MAVIKELYPGWTSSIAGFRPYGIISYTQNNVANTTTYKMDLYGEMLDVNGVINGIIYSFITNVGGTTQQHTGQIDTTYVSSGQKVYLGYQEKIFNNNDAGTSPTLPFQIGGDGVKFKAPDGVWEPQFGYFYQGTSEIWYHTAPTIPRISSVTSNANTVANKKDFGVQVDFTISRYSSSFTHTLEFVSGGTTYTIGTGLATSGSYIFPVSLIPNYPSSGSPTVTVTCKTYNGGSLIGTASTTVYLNVPSSYIPTCSLAVVDTNSITSTWGIWVKSKSILQGTITTAGVSGSTISSYSSTVDGGVPLTTNPFTRSISASGDLDIISTVSDTRGRTASDTETITVVDYTVPTLTSIELKRCLSNGALDEDGTYGKVVCTYAISSCSDNNDKSLKVTIGAVTKTFTLSNYSGTYTATDLFSGLLTTGTYTATFKLEDSFYSGTTAITQPFTVTPSYNTISYHDGGKGVTVGQVATEDGFNCYMDADFKKIVKITNTNIGTLFSINGIIIAEIVEE